MTIDKETTYTIVLNWTEFNAIKTAISTAQRVTTGKWPPGYELGLKIFTHDWDLITIQMEDNE